MARKRAKNNLGRDISRIARANYTALPLSKSSLLPIEDNRRFSPEPSRPARAFNQLRAPLKVVLSPRKRPTFNQVFADPLRTIVCIRRKVRKEVMHASGAAGSRVQRPRFNEKSKISCKG